MCAHVLGHLGADPLASSFSSPSRVCLWHQTLLGREIQAERTRDKGLSEKQTRIRETEQGTKALENCGRCESLHSGGGGRRLGRWQEGGPAWVLRPQLGGGGWFRVSRRKAEEG